MNVAFSVRIKHALRAQPLRMDNTRKEPKKDSKGLPVVEKPQAPLESNSDAPPPRPVVRLG